MENPYQSPVESSEPLGGPLPIGAYTRQPGLVRHVRVVAVLMIIQGSLELLLGVVLGALPFFLSRIMMHSSSDVSPPPGVFSTAHFIMFGVFAILMMTVAGLHIVAGLQNFQFRNRTLGIVAMAAGVATLFTFYCLPTAVAIGVYGLIVFLNEEVAEAFCMGEARHKAQDILAAFNPNVVLSSPFAPLPPAFSQRDESSVNKETEP